MAGRRVQLSKVISEQLEPKKVKDGWIEKRYFTSILWDTAFGKTKHFEKGFRLVSPLLKNSVTSSNPLKEILGCNFSIHKDSMVSINGFDERYLLPCYGEDKDIDLRYKNHGGKVKFLRLCAVQYHIDHPLLSRKNLEANELIYNENMKFKIGFTQYGIDRSSNDI